MTREELPLPYNSVHRQGFKRDISLFLLCTTGGQNQDLCSKEQIQISGHIYTWLYISNRNNCPTTRQGLTGKYLTCKNLSFIFSQQYPERTPPLLSLLGYEPDLMAEITQIADVLPSLFLCVLLVNSSILKHNLHSETIKLLLLTSNNETAALTRNCN